MLKKVTTNTYKPSEGIWSETNSKGNLLLYHYDGFGCLEKVTRDSRSGVTMKTFKYKYEQ